MRQRRIALTVAAVVAVLASWSAPALAARAPSGAAAPCLRHLAPMLARYGGILAPRATRGAIESCGSPRTMASRYTPPVLPYTGTPPLVLHAGGSVMGATSAITVTPVYWAPSGYSFASTYKSLTTRFVTDVAHDSGDHTNVFASLTQYTDAAAHHVPYNVVAGTAVVDTTAYPTSSTCSPDSGQTYSDGTGYSACLSDAAIRTELQSVVTNNSLTSDLNHLYLMFLPKGVESCFTDQNNAGGGSCTISQGGGAYCGYHSFVGTTVYANLPYAIEDNPGTGATCSSDGGVLQGNTSVGNQTPNGNLDADTVLSVTSHEMSEAFTDPLLNAWYDSSGNENGDECAYIYGDSTSFGGSAGAKFNQVINGNSYFIQEEFSNQQFGSDPNFACVQQVLAQTVSFTSTPPSNPPVSSGYVVTASATSSLAPTISIDASSSSICSINGSVSGSFVSFNALGTCTIDAIQKGSSKYAPAPLAQQSIAVGGSISDGAGTLVASPTSVRRSATGNTLTFTYTASGAGTTAGEIDVAVPGGWPAPSTSLAAQGAVTTTCGTVGVSGSTFLASAVTVAGSATCTFTYGATSGGGPGATAPSSLGTSTFTATEKSTSGGALTALASSPSVLVSAAPDGSGTMVGVPTTAHAAQTGLTLTLTYTAAAGGTATGEVDVVVPAGWSAPSTSSVAAGAISTTCGSAGVAGSTVRLTAVSLAAGASCTLTYGDTAGGGPGATATSTTGTSTFATTEKSTSGGALTALASSPSVLVSAAPDGSGTMVGVPTTAHAAQTGLTLTLTYTAAAGGTATGEVDVVVPAGWSAPSTSSVAAGAISTTCGSAGVAGSTVRLTAVSLAAGASCTLTYGDTAGGGPGATATSTTGTSTFATTEKSTSGGVLTALASSPTVVVSKAQSSLVLTVSVPKVSYGKEQLATFHVTAHATNAAIVPSGTVTVTTASTVACSITLSGGAGSCAMTAWKLAPGTRSFVATYAGTTSLAGSMSAPILLTVTRAATQTSLHLSMGSVTLGQEGKERLSVSVAPATPGVIPAGTVRITAGRILVCTVTLRGGTGACSPGPRSLAVGVARLVARYAGSAFFLPSSSTSRRLTVTR